MMVIKWWQLIVVGLVIFGIGIGTGYLFHKPPIVIASPTVTIQGKPDTVKVEVPTAHGSESYWPVPTSHSTDSNSVGFPFFSFTKTTDSVQNGVHFIFRSTTYPFIDSTGKLRDSARIIHEWNIIPAPAHIITRVDTVRVTMSTVELPRPLYEKPSFMFGTGMAVGIGITILILRSIK